MNKFIRGFGYALRGLTYASRTQLNFRVHLVAALTAVFLGLALRISSPEWLWIALCIGLVLVAELFNTAMEIFSDIVSPGYNEQIGRVKDICAAAVLLTALLTLVIGLSIFLPKLLGLLQYAA